MTMPTSTPLTTAKHQQPQDLTTPAAEILTAAFSNSIFLSYFLRSPESSWPPGQIPGDLLQAHFQKIIPEKVQQGAEVVLAGSTCSSEGSAEWVAAAAWFPPGQEIPITPDTDWRLREYREKFNAVKARRLHGQRYWYLNIIGRHPERAEPGAVRALFEPYFQKARQEGIPLWLEAISEHSRLVYEHLSFQTVAQVRVGVGKVNGRGEFDENGEGLVIYGMIAE